MLGGPDQLFGTHGSGGDSRRAVIADVPRRGTFGSTMFWVNYSIHGPPTPQLKIPQFGSQRPRDPKNLIPRVRFMKIRPARLGPGSWGRRGHTNR